MVVEKLLSLRSVQNRLCQALHIEGHFQPLSEQKGDIVQTRNGLVQNPTPEQVTCELAELGGEPLSGSGFEAEEPEPDFAEIDDSQPEVRQ